MYAFQAKFSEVLIARAAIVWTVLVWTTVSGLTPFGIFQPADRGLQDLTSQLAPSAPTRDDIVIVSIDAQSFKHFGDRWPWTRDRHAALLDAAKAAGAKAVVFDIVFDAQTEADSAFAAAIERFGPVILASETDVTATPQGLIETRSLPTAALRTVAASFGDAGLRLDGDGRLRHMPQNSSALAYAAASAIDPAAPPSGTDEGFIPFSTQGFPKTVSYYQALLPEDYLPPGALADKILLVGLALDANPTGRATGDTILLPGYINGADPQPGVGAQAHVLAAALSGNALRRAHWMLEAFLLLAAAAGSLALVSVARTSTPQSLGLGAAGLTALIAALWLARNSGVVVMAGAAAWGWIAAILGQAAIIGGSALAAKRRLSAGFSRYVSPDLLKQILAQPQPPELGGEVRTVSVVVTDLAGFTAMMERLDPGAGADLLRDYLETLSDVVLAHGGMVDQFIGDSIVAVFNAPLDQQDHAARAVACIIALDEASEAFRADRPGVGVTRIGGAIGQAMVGNFGARRRFHYTAMGDVVNTAARLEAANKETCTRALATEGLLQAAGAPEGFDPAIEIDVAGKAEPLRVAPLKTKKSTV